MTGITFLWFLFQRMFFRFIWYLAGAFVSLGGNFLTHAILTKHTLHVSTVDRGQGGNV